MRKQPERELRGEAQNFVDLARKLLSVPKKEVDEQRAKYEKGKQHKDEKRTK